MQTLIFATKQIKKLKLAVSEVMTVPLESNLFLVTEIGNKKH